MIVIAGEALIDLIPTDSDGLSVNPGGGPFNTARWLSRLGQPVAFLGALSADPLGLRLRQALARSGVNLDLVAETALPTTLALAHLDGSGAAQYSFYADATSIRGLTVAAVNATLPRVEALTAMQVGGVALMLQPSGAALERAVELAHHHGALVQFDPNVRSSLIPDRTDYMHRFELVLDHADVLKLSVEDLAWLFPGDSHDAAAARFLGAGPSVVVLTDGGEGAAVYARAGSPEGLRIPAEAVEVADTIGAGDAFGAGFLAHLLHHADAAGHPSSQRTDPRTALADPDLVTAAARFAIRVAAVACAQRGAEPPATLPDMA